MSNHPHAVANNWTRQNSFTARDIDVGYEHVAIILDNGSAVAWGYSRNAATGNGDRTVYGWEGGVVLSGVKDIALGTHHSCYLYDNGTATCVGKNERKQLGSSVDTSNGCGTGVECSETLTISNNYLLAVKPQLISTVCQELNIHNPRRVISIAAGVTIQSIEENFDSDTAVLRVMPNTPAMVGEGMSAIAAGSFASS